jgi:hypothetical protein
MAIEISALEQMFANIRADTNWNIDGPMQWGYFFADGDADALQRLGAELAREGYRLVDVFLADKEAGDEDEDDVYFLHVERIETHTIDSLRRRNEHLQAMAEHFGVATYDGMDVGPPPH